ncbi:hypothetical protein BGX26_011319, partial [Mortierella sp. AD094]
MKFSLVILSVLASIAVVAVAAPANESPAVAIDPRPGCPPIQCYPLDCECGVLPP